MASADTPDLRHPSDFRTPGLVLLAVASVLEGYASLGTIGAPSFVTGPAGAFVFALGCLGFAIGLTRAAEGARHTFTQLYLLRASALLAAVTLAFVIGVPGFGQRSVGASDLVLAIAALVAAAAVERRSIRHRHAARHPSQRSSKVVSLR
jgi:hypothetical protein